MLHRICFKPDRLVLKQMPPSVMVVTSSPQPTALSTQWTRPQCHGKFLKRNILYPRANVEALTAKLVLLVALLNWGQLCFITPLGPCNSNIHRQVILVNEKLLDLLHVPPLFTRCRD